MRKEFLKWDEGDIIEEQVQFLKEEYPEDTEEELYGLAGNMDMSFYWDDMLDYLTEWMNRKNPAGYWYASINDFGWMKSSGYNYFKADNGQAFLKEILPNTDCSFTIYNNGKGFKIINYHHDAPTGETYYIKPIAESTYEKN